MQQVENSEHDGEHTRPRLALEQPPSGHQAQHRGAEQEDADHVQKAVDERRRFRRQNPTGPEERQQEESGNQMDRGACKPENAEQAHVTRDPPLHRHQGHRARRFAARRTEALSFRQFRPATIAKHFAYPSPRSYAPAATVVPCPALLE